MLTARRILFETLEDRVVLSAGLALAAPGAELATVAPSANHKVDVKWTVPSSSQLDSMIHFVSQVGAIEQMVDSGLGCVPGWHTKANFSKPLSWSASVDGAVYVTSDGKLDCGSVTLSVSFGVSGYVEGYWPLEIANAGVGLSLSPSITIGGTAGYSKANGWKFYMSAGMSCSAKLYTQATAALWKGSLDVTGNLGSTYQCDTSGNVTIKSGFSGSWGAEAFWRPFPGADWIPTIPRISTQAWDVHVPDYHTSVAPFIQQAIAAALGGGSSASLDTAGLLGEPSVATDSLVVTTQPPYYVTAGTPFGLTVTANKPDGSTDTAFNGDVTVSNASGFGNLMGNTTVTAVSGVATFSGLTMTVASPYYGVYSLKAASEGLSGTTTNRFQVSPLPASQLAILGSGTNILPGVPFGLQVFAEDAYGNLDTNFTGQVTLDLGANFAGGTLSGVLSVAAVRGVATFSGLSIDTAGDGYAIRATGGSLPAQLGSPFNVTNEQLVVTTQPPASVKAGSAFRLVAKIENGKGKVDTAFNGLVTLSGDILGQPLLGKTTVRASKGVATFSGLKLNEASASNVLIVTASGLPSTVSRPFDVVATTAKRLVVVAPPPSKVSAAAPFDVAIAARDANGNVVTGFKGTVTLRLANNPGGAILGGKLTATAVGGVAVFHNLTLDKTGSGFALQMTAKGLAAATVTFDVTPAGTATHLVVTSQPPSQIAAGSDFGLTVSAEDGFGTVDTDFSGDVTIGDPSGSGLQGILTLPAVDGVATFTGLSREQAGSDLSLPAVAAGLDPATTNSFTVDPLSATQLDVWGPSNSVLPGSPFGMTVFAEDPFGNVDPNFGGSVTLAWADNSNGAILDGTLAATAAKGKAYFAGLTIDRIGNDYSLQAETTTLPDATSMSFNVTSDQLAVTSQPPGLMPIGSAFGLTVAAKDAAGNVDTSFHGDVTVTLIDCGGIGAVLSGTHTVTATSGIAVLSGFTLDQAGYYGLAVTADGVGATSSSGITVTSTAIPSISSILPASGPVAGGTAVTINGTNLANATAVYFGNKAAKIKPKTNTATQIIVTSPAGVAGEVDVTVVTANGTSSTWSADKFIYGSVPVASPGPILVKATNIGLLESAALGSQPVVSRAIDAAILALSDALNSMGGQHRREIDFFTNPPAWI